MFRESSPIKPPLTYFFCVAGVGYMGYSSFTDDASTHQYTPFATIILALLPFTKNTKYMVTLFCSKPIKMQLPDMTLNIKCLCYPLYNTMIKKLCQNVKPF